MKLDRDTATNAVTGEASPVWRDSWPRLEAALLGLHASTDAPGLWRAAQRLLRQAVPCHRVTLFLGHAGMSAAKQVFTDPPIADTEAWYAARSQRTPFKEFIDANRGVPLYRFSDVVNIRTWEGGAFFKEFAAPEGWDKGVSVLFWTGTEVKAMFSLYRAPESAEFSDRELEVLRGLYPHFETAIDRVREILGERLARAGLEEFNRTLPIGLMLLDWGLELIFANQTAFDHCAAWNLGRDAARQIKTRGAFALPGALRTVCETLRREFSDSDAHVPPGRREARVEAAPPFLSVRVTLLARMAEAAARPRFLIVLEPSLTAASEAEPGLAADSVHLRQLRSLTPREREVVELVCQGLSNAEIAKRLGRSVLTIKTQLSAVFSKTGLRSRARLIAQLRRG